MKKPCSKPGCLCSWKEMRHDIDPVITRFESAERFIILCIIVLAVIVVLAQIWMVL